MAWHREVRAHNKALPRGRTLLLRTMTTKRKRGQETRLIDIPALTVPMLGQNHHLVHHLYPRVPFYRYAALLEEIRGEVAHAPVVRWPVRLRRSRA